jgi:hypothetical protein
LPRCRQRVLSQLLKHTLIVKKLDEICFQNEEPNSPEISGLVEGLELTNWGRELATHCFEQILNFLHHIRQTWGPIIEYIDLKTVKRLQYLAPSASSADRQLITDMIASGQIFLQVYNPEARHSLREYILSLKVVIPSMATFHTQMRYLRIGAKILQRDLEVPARITDEDIPTSLYQNLSRAWSPRESSMIEISENRFQSVPGPPSPSLAFTVIFLSVLRSFARLSYTRPLLDRRDQKPTPAAIESACQFNLRKNAKLLGFSNSKIEDGLRATASPSLEQELISPDDDDISGWRGGIPTRRIYLYFQRSAFIPFINQPRPSGKLLHPLFILSDILGAFFDCGPHTYQDFEDIASPSTPSPLHPIFDELERQQANRIRLIELSHKARAKLDGTGNEEVDKSKIHPPSPAPPITSYSPSSIRSHSRSPIESIRSELAASPLVNSQTEKAIIPNNTSDMPRIIPNSYTEFNILNIPPASKEILRNLASKRWGRSFTAVDLGGYGRSPSSNISLRPLLLPGKSQANNNLEQLVPNNSQPRWKLKRPHNVLVKKRPRQESEIDTRPPIPPKDVIAKNRQADNTTPDVDMRPQLSPPAQKRRRLDMTEAYQRATKDANKQDTEETANDANVGEAGTSAQPTRNVLVKKRRRDNTTLDVDIRPQISSPEMKRRRLDMTEAHQRAAEAIANDANVREAGTSAQPTRNVLVKKCRRDNITPNVDKRPQLSSPAMERRGLDMAEAHRRAAEAANGQDAETANDANVGEAETRTQPTDFVVCSPSGNEEWLAQSRMIYCGDSEEEISTPA